MQTTIILDFLKGLKANNTKEWMQEHKKEYQEAQAAFTDLIQELILLLSKSDDRLLQLSAKDLIFRLNRDTRFSNDKAPYNPAFRAHISPGGRVPVPVGYYIHISPDCLFLGGGLFASQLPDATARVRARIAEQGKEFDEIVHAPSFTDNFVLLGEKLKNVPREYEKDHPYGEYLKHKSWDIEYHFSEEMFQQEGFAAFAAEKFLLMRPFHDFLNQALEGFQMPQR